MHLRALRSSLILTAVIAALVIVASAGGLLIAGLYRDNLWTSSQFRGSDLVRLLVATPVLIASAVLTLRGSLRALLVWLGALWVTLYDYAFYVFGAAFNEFFLIYVAIFTASLLALIFALPRVDAAAISSRFSDRTPVRAIAAYTMLIPLFLGTLWIAQSLSFVFTGMVPQPVLDSGHPTGVVYALDLSLLAPAAVLGAVWLWQRRPWGYVLATMVNVKGVTYTLALVGMGVFAERAGVEGASGLMPLWIFFAIGCAIATLALLWSMSRATEADSAPVDRLSHAPATR